MPSPSCSRQVETPEKQQTPDVIDLTTDSESEAIYNSTTKTREYMRTPQRPAPQTSSTNSSATSSRSENIPEVFDNVGRDESLATPSPNSSIGEGERDIFQSDFKSRDGFEEIASTSTEERIRNYRKRFKQAQTTKGAKRLIPKMNDERNLIQSPRSRSRIFSRSGELTPRKVSPEPVEQQSLKPIRPSPRAVQTSSGSPSSKITTRRTSAEFVETKRPISERASGLSDDDPNQIPIVVEHPDDSREKSETIIVPESLPYPRFIEYKKPRKQHTTNSKIIDLLMEGSSPQTAETKTGWIYVLESTTHAKGHVKIGKTVDSCLAREKAWRKCNFPIERVEDSMKAFDHCSIAERLIMLELHNSRKKFECQICRGKKGIAMAHTEWFEIDQEAALKHVQKWRKWIDEHQPFSEDGKLTGYWRWKTGKLSRQGGEIDWRTWTDPYRLEKHVYQIRRHLERKDRQCYVVGFAMLFILDRYDGSWRAFLGLIALLIL